MEASLALCGEGYPTETPEEFQTFILEPLLSGVLYQRDGIVHHSLFFFRLLVAYLIVSAPVCWVIDGFGSC